MAIEAPEAVARELRYPRRDLWILLAIAAATRLLMLPVNEAEYTDGVLQVRTFAEPHGGGAIWPPLYAALVYPLHFVFGYLWSGRLVSAVASTLALYPIYRMAQRAFGTRAALYAGIFYIAAPVANRWGVRLMTDASFSLFFFWACERMCFAAGESDGRQARRALGWAAAMAVLASLTRYQGAMLVPPVLVCAWLLWRRGGAVPWKPLLPLLGLALLPAWSFAIGFIHDEQFESRSLGGGAGAALKVFALNAEAFAAFTPYFLTYPVFVLALFGMFWTRQRRGPFFGWLMLYVAVVLLVVQGLFSSFQERYFLPLYGFFWVLTGAGMWAIQERWGRHGRRFKQRAFPYLLILSVAWSAGWSLMVVYGHRDAFGDLARASRAAAEIGGPEARLYTNEFYRLQSTPPIAANKASFFAGRRVVFLGEQFVPMRPGPDGRPAAPARFLEPGSIIILSDAYAGEFFLESLQRHYRLEPLVDEPFRAVLFPLFPDIMAEPGRAQNPLAWHSRYNPQFFATMLYRVEGRR